MKIENGVLSKVNYLDIVNGEFIIPNSVTEIKDYAFVNCDSLQSIIIPNSVIEIRSLAFYHCHNLESINVNNDNELYSSEDGVLFNKSKMRLINYPQGKKDKKYIISDSVIVIGYASFYHCYNLELITIADSVTLIGCEAFTYCNSLKLITIPDSVIEIGYSSFSNCRKLGSINIPYSIVEIGEKAFYKCKKLQSKKGNYKAFKKGLICKDMHYIPNEWNKIEGEIKLCEWGLHYVTNLFDIFNYYSGNLEEDIEIWEIEVGDIIVNNGYDSKKATNAIKPIKRLTKQEIIDILNNK